jgi:PAS domain S-box-containing protein
MTRFAQERLDETAEELFENAPCGYLSTMPDGTLLRVNETFLRWTGYRREELVGVKRFQDLLSVGGRIYHETHYAPLLRMQGTVREIAVDVLASGGERLPVLVNSVLVRDAAGAPQGVRTTIVDARERKSYERELLAARDRERAARERVERLQRITASLAEATDPSAVAAAVTGELKAALGAQRAGLDVRDELPAAPAFDEGGDGRGAAVRLPCGGTGLLWLDWDQGRQIEPEERAFLLSCALQTGSALERARLNEETREVAHSLQRNLLAGELPQDERFAIASAYHAAVETMEVGGDWYDAFRLPSGRLGVVVGDVVGRGLSAASAMGQLRSAVRALAGAGLQPAEVVRHLDTFVEQVAAARYATVVYAEVAAEDGGVTLASAGHLPAVVIAADGAAELFMEGRSTPLGVTAPGRAREQARLTLEPGGGFLLYTDGLVERRDEAIDVSLERLLAEIRDEPGASPARLVDALLGALMDARAVDDDVCLLSFRLTSPG